MMIMLSGIDLENAAVNGDENGSVENLPSALWSTHMDELRNGAYSEAFPVTAYYILRILGQTYPDSDRLLSNLGAVNQRVENNAITTVRRLELEILQAGKVSRQHFPQPCPRI